MKKISTAHILLLLVVVSQHALSYILQLANIRVSIVTALFLSQGTILLPVLVYCACKKKNLFELIRFRKIKISTALLCALVGLASYPVVVFLNLLSMMFVENAMAEVMSQVLSMGLGVGVFCMAFLPAVVEETVFRGVIYNTYSKRNPILGVVLSALLFGLMHMNFNQLPYAFYLGIILALLMEASDSILAPMILHFTMNAVSTTLTFLSGGATESVTTESTDIKSMLLESYRQSAASMGMELTEAELTAMTPMILGMVIGVFAILALIALAVVLTLIYAVFRSNNRKLLEVFRADHSDTAYVAGANDKVHKNRMIDPWLVIFIVYTLWQCILSI